MDLLLTWTYLADLGLPDIRTRLLQSQDAGLLNFLRISKQRAGGRAFFHKAKFLWKGLPIYVREADSVSTFRSLLKTHLFSRSYDWVLSGPACEGEWQGTGMTNHPGCLCLAGSPLSTGILCLWPYYGGWVTGLLVLSHAVLGRGASCCARLPSLYSTWVGWVTDVIFFHVLGQWVGYLRGLCSHLS